MPAVGSRMPAETCAFLYERGEATYATMQL